MEFGTVNFQYNFFCCFKVNYVGKAGNLYQSGYQLNGSAYVISKHISNTWLWDRVRVSGGAYGGFCDFDTHSGTYILFLDLLFQLSPNNM
jgi:Zn-dependent M16 (insulinase) family peptidase